MKNIVIIGATSAIAQSILRIHAEAKDSIFLIARNQQHLATLADDAKVRGAVDCEMYAADLADTENHPAIWQAAYKRFTKPDIVYIAHGVLPDQIASQSAYKEFEKSNQVNACSPISLLTELANRMEQAQHGNIVVISSVAGDRGRKSNYVYGAQKAMLSIFAEGLRYRLYDAGVNVTIIKPGFVDTPMTSEFKKGILWASADQVAKLIVKAAAKRKGIVYTPSFWFFIMFIIKQLPDFIFKRINF